MSYLSAHLGKTLPVVSVGSGMGVEEQALVVTGYKVVCIDPTPVVTDRYSSKAMTRRPDFKTVRDYLASTPEYSGQIHLLLHYPLPDYGMYDIHAIHDLRRKLVTVMATMGGSAGSFLLHVWLRQCGVPTLGKKATEDSAVRLPGIQASAVVVDRYRLVKFEQLPVQTGNDRQGNAYGVHNVRFVATLLRIGPYRVPERLVSSCHEERIELGHMHTTEQCQRSLEYLKSLSMPVA